jgi:hypothetical protein
MRWSSQFAWCWVCITLSGLRNSCNKLGCEDCSLYKVTTFEFKYPGCSYTTLPPQTWQNDWFVHSRVLLLSADHHRPPHPPAFIVHEWQCVPAEVSTHSTSFYKDSSKLRVPQSSRHASPSSQNRAFKFMRWKMPSAVFQNSINILILLTGSQTIRSVSTRLHDSTS